MTMLPNNASPAEKALEASISRLSGVPVPVRAMWNPDTCPSAQLPWLAWAWGVDEWDADWSEEAKRETIRAAYRVQSRKGTMASIKRVLINAGYGNATIFEGASGSTHNGTMTHNGENYHGDATEWARYRVILDRPITNIQADQVRRILKKTAPARCHLLDLSYVTVANTHNGTAYHDGTFNHGAA